MLTDPDLTDNMMGYVEGRIDSKNYKPKQPNPANFPPFTRMVVLDVIFDPNHDAFDEKKKAYWKSLGVANLEWIDTLPRNTIIAKKIAEEADPIFVFPFFPSHLSLPCKPGECVWVFFENSPSLQVSGIRAYWICRIAEPHVVDDVNHTHAPRIFEPTLRATSEDLYKASKNNESKEFQTIHELRNGPVVIVNSSSGSERQTSSEGTVLKGQSEDIFEQLVTTSDASKLMSYESVPRYRKRPGDIALEGTNNSLIVLGTDRSGPIADYSDSSKSDDIAKRTQVVSYPAGDFNGFAGCIDLVAGRGQVPETYGVEASTVSITKNTSNVDIEIKKELNKSYSNISQREGDPDFINDRSRILISQRTNVDDKLGIVDYNSSNFVPSLATYGGDGDAAILIKSDKVRIVARSDVQFLVTNFSDELSPAGKFIKKDEPDQTNWSSITIKSNGDIVFKPSDKGYIKLGDDDADKAILCTDKPAIIQEGNVSYMPGLITTGASVVGTGAAGQGTFAKKVLVK